MALIKVLLAEDHHLLRRLLVEHLRSAKDIQIVGAASNGREAVRLAERTHPDVALLDYDMPLLSGGEAARRIRERCPDTRIVILSDFPPTDLPWIDDWLRKEQVENICKTLRQLASRPGSARRLNAAPAETGWDDLTEGQRNALHLLVTEGLSNKEIAARLSRAEGAVVSETAVKKRLTAVMDKWGVEPRTRGRLIQVAGTKVPPVTGTKDPSPPSLCRL